MRNSFLTLVFILSAGLGLFAQNGYRIEVEVQNYDQDSLFLGFYYGDKQYLKDTAIQVKGKFVFKNEEALKPGTYLLILRPDNAFVQLNINEGKQDLKLKFDAANPVPTIDFKGEKENTAFYTYIRFLNDMRPKADQVRLELEKADISDAEKKRLQAKLLELNEEVRVFQDKLIRENKGTLTAMMVATFIERIIPDFAEEQDEKERQRKQYRFFMDHYFDGLDFNDPRLIRTNFAFTKIQDYVTKHTVQIPDSINASIDMVMHRMKDNEDAYKFFLVHFVNYYAKSNIIGMDAVYVHIVEKYYNQGAAPWVDAEQLEKMRKNAETLKPILIGKIAPDIRMQRKDGSKISLHEIKSPYTILMFWAPDCGHCQKTMPKVTEFYQKYKDQGVEVFSVCTKLTDKVEDCWKMVEEKEMGQLLNVVDPYHLSKFSLLYDVRTTPQIFILDEKKEILLKRISTEQLEEVMQEVLERKRLQEEELK